MSLIKWQNQQVQAHQKNAIDRGWSRKFGTTQMKNVLFIKSGELYQRNIETHKSKIN